MEAAIPGMQGAMTILTARLASMGSGDMDVEDYLQIIRKCLQEEDPVILVSGLASLAAGVLTFASSVRKTSPDQLLSEFGLGLARS